ncbi:MAG: ABC transporter permease subunit [Pseudodonghicola sp.]
MEKRATFRNGWLAAALILPQLLLVFLFFYWPTGEALYWAFTLEPPFGGSNDWVGLYNFESVFGDPNYWSSVCTSLGFAIAATGLSLILALLLALFVDRRLRGHKVYGFSFFLPYALAAPAVGLAFRFIFSPDAGIFAAVNRLVPGLWNPALDGGDALVMITLAQAWSLVGYNFIFFLAGLQSIPRALQEAGALDGAGPLRRMWDLQLPLLSPTLFFLIVINITDSFVNSFGIVDIMTAGGPARATELMVYKIFTDGFQGKDYSLAAAQSMVLMTMIVALTFIQFRFVERRVHYS